MEFDQDVTIKDAFKSFVDKDYVKSQEIATTIIRNEFLTKLKDRLGLEKDIQKE